MKEPESTDELSQCLDPAVAAAVPVSVADDPAEQTIARSEESVPVEDLQSEPQVPAGAADIPAAVKHFDW